MQQQRRISTALCLEKQARHRRTIKRLIQFTKHFEKDETTETETKSLVVRGNSLFSHKGA